MAGDDSRSSDRVAAFDIGSNTVRGIAAQVQPDGRLRPVLRAFRTTALGRGLAETGRLDPAAIRSTVGFVVSFLNACDHPATVWAVATAAARDADNTDELAELLRTRAGVALEVISGEEEARLSFLGATSVVTEYSHSNVVVADPGGRSTELVTREGAGLRAVSVPVGARSLTERCIRGDPPSEAEIHLARATALGLLQAALPVLDGAGGLIVTGGTAQSAVLLGGKAQFTASEMAALLGEMCALDLRGRRDRMPFDPKRAEIICAGLALLEVLIEHAPDRRTFMTNAGLREGLLLQRTGASAILPGGAGPEGELR